MPLGTPSPAWKPGLRHRLCSASSQGSVEPPWIQVSRDPLPWVWGSCAEPRAELWPGLGSRHSGRRGGWRQSAWTQASRAEAALLASGRLFPSCQPDARPPARSASGGGRREHRPAAAPGSPGLTLAAPMAASGPQYHLLSEGTADRLWEASGQCLRDSGGAVGQGVPLGLSQTPGLHSQVGSAEGLGLGSTPGACLLPTFPGSSCLGCPRPRSLRKPRTSLHPQCLQGGSLE